VKFLCRGANLRLADEEARERISVDAVRGVGPLRMIRREMDSTAPAAVLSTSHQCKGTQRLKVILSLQPTSVEPFM